MDLIGTTDGELQINFIGHGTLMFEFNGKTIHVDPWTEVADYASLPKADLILVTHEHRDHLDLAAIEILRKQGTQIVVNPNSSEQVPDALVMENEDVKVIQGIEVEAVPAYNIVNRRESGEPFHPKGQGNGYVMTFGDKRVYVAGDTENTPTMRILRNIHCAFLPMNSPYTMTPKMVAEAAEAFKPAILYPYHCGDTDTSILVELLKDSDIDVRIRDM